MLLYNILNIYQGLTFRGDPGVCEQTHPELGLCASDGLGPACPIFHVPLKEPQQQIPYRLINKLVGR